MKKTSIIPILFILFIFGYISLDSFFIYLSKSSYNGVVTDNAYEKGLNYNQVIKKNREQKELRWAAGLTYNKIDTKQIELKLTLSDRDRNPITEARVLAYISRPVTDKYDREILLQEEMQGIYTKQITLPLEGQWEIKIKAFAQGKEYFLNRRIIIGDKKQDSN